MPWASWGPSLVTLVCMSTSQPESKTGTPHCSTSVPRGLGPVLISRPGIAPVGQGHPGPGPHLPLLPIILSHWPGWTVEGGSRYHQNLPSNTRLAGQTQEGTHWRSGYWARARGGDEHQTPAERCACFLTQASARVRAVCFYPTPFYR